MKLYFIILLGLVLVLAACENAQKSGQEANSDSQSADASTNSNAQAQSTSNQQGTGSASASSGALSDFKKVFSGRSSAQWQVTYDASANSGGQQTNFAMTQYLKGKNKVRNDAAVQGIETRSYILDNVLTTCSKNDNKWTCYGSEMKKDAVAKFEDEADTSQDYKVESDGTKAVAGVTAKCYKVTDHENSYTIRYCFSSEGVPLYIKFDSSDASSEMTATSYSKTVSDSVFEVPAAASTMEIPSGGASGGDACSYCNYMSGSDKDSCLQSCGQ